MNLLDSHYTNPCISYNFLKRSPLSGMGDEPFFVSKELTDAVIDILRGSFVQAIVLDNDLSFGFHTSRQYYKTEFFIRSGFHNIGIAPQMENLKYRIPLYSETIYEKIFYNIGLKLSKTSVTQKEILIEKDKAAQELESQYTNQNYKPDVWWPHSLGQKRLRNPHFEELFLSNKFNVVTDNTDVYVFYGNLPCFIISSEWHRCIPGDLVDKYNLKSYNTSYLKKSFADVIVKILNNR